MTPIIILTIMALACLYAVLLYDRRRYWAYRKRRDEQANAAWRKRGGK